MSGLPSQEALQEMMGSLHLLKRMTCSIALPLVNVTPPSPLGYSVVTFCTSNNTVFEAALHAIDQVPFRPNALALQTSLPTLKTRAALDRC